MTSQAAGTITRETAIELIASLDKVLSDLRKSWLRGTVAEQPQVWLLINEAIDERLLLMALR